MKTFSKGLVVWLTCFFGFGQLLFGCANKKQLSWERVEKIRIVTGGRFDREVINLEMKKIDLEIKKIESNTTTKEEIPVTVTTTWPDIESEESIAPLIERKVDATALAIIQLGKVANTLAERMGQPVTPVTDPLSAIVAARVSNGHHKQPESQPVAIIRETGKAVGAVAPWLQNVFFGWLAADTLKSVSNNPPLIGGDMVTGSNNPVVTNTSTEVAK